jgi:DNA-binding MarR family transcriptional regulator
VDPKDNRFTLVTLAPASQQVLEEMEILGEAFEAQPLEELSEEKQATLVQALKHIQNNVSRMAG